jgi:hypothetical protein
MGQGLFELSLDRRRFRLTVDQLRTCMWLVAFMCLAKLAMDGRVQFLCIASALVVLVVLFSAIGTILRGTSERGEAAISWYAVMSADGVSRSLINTLLECSHADAVDAELTME